MGKYMDWLFQLEKIDGVNLIQSEIDNNYYIGIKENSMLLISKNNGKFCANAEIFPVFLKELSDIYNMYFAKDSKYIKVMWKKVKQSA